jgi:uncharacterized membrane protein
MADIRILLAGESWVSNTTHFKGWDYFSSTVYEVGKEYLEKALTGGGFSFEHLPGHLAPTNFPSTLEALNHYDVVILSDIGANSLLLHPDTWLHGKTSPNRLKLLQTWVEQGGGLVMCGGYMSFAGIYGSAKFYRTPIESILPVNINPFDDRMETPEGVIAQINDSSHPIVQGLTGEWPALLGYNELTLKPEGQLLASVGDHPLLAVRSVGAGRTLVWASDVGPHWCPQLFLQWEGYTRLWQQAIRWLAGG